MVSKAQILDNVWDSAYEGGDNIVEVYIGYLRRKIDAPFGVSTLHTVRGLGLPPGRGAQLRRVHAHQGRRGSSAAVNRRPVARGSGSFSSHLSVQESRGWGTVPCHLFSPGSNGGRGEGLLGPPTGRRTITLPDRARTGQDRTVASLALLNP